MKILHGNIRKEKGQKQSKSLTGRQIAWMIYENFKISDTAGTVLVMTSEE